MEGKEIFSQIARISDHIKAYIETKLSYLGILAFEKAVKTISLLMANAFVFMAGLLALMFLSGAAAIYLGSLLDSLLYGMLIVAGFYLLLLIILVAARKRIFGRMAIRIVKQIALQDDEPAGQK